MQRRRPGATSPGGRARRLPSTAHARRTLPGVRLGALVGAVLFAFVVVMPAPATAWPESAAPNVDARLAAVGHTPEAVGSGTDFEAFIRLAPGSGVVAASMQVCRVGQACFAPPTPAHATADGFALRLSEHAPVSVQGGWDIGVRWVLVDSAGNETVVPSGPDPTDPSCAGDVGALACQEQHYFTFQVAAHRSAPAAPLVWVVCGLLVTVVATRRADA